MSQQTTDPITTNTDTTVLAAPGAAEIRKISSILIGVSVIGTTAAIRFEDGVNGDVLFSHLAVAGGKVINFPRYAPLVLSAGNLLNAATIGGGSATWHCKSRKKCSSILPGSKRFGPFTA